MYHTARYTGDFNSTSLYSIQAFLHPISYKYLTTLAPLMAGRCVIIPKNSDSKSQLYGKAQDESSEDGTQQCNNANGRYNTPTAEENEYSYSTTLYYIPKGTVV